jgi:hypothetical protein
MNDDDGLFIGGDPFDDPLWQGATKPVRRAKRVQDGSLIGCRAAWLEQVLPHIKSKEQLGGGAASVPTTRPLCGEGIYFCKW